MKVLVTGGAGFIGSHLVDKLVELGHSVLVLDNLSNGKKENINPKAEFHQVDICDFEIMCLYFKDIDYVFHLAALPRIPFSIQNPIGTSNVNIMGTINVFEAAKQNKVKRVISTSSSSVYGNQDKLPLKEDMALNPISPYGLQKWVGEQFAKLYTEIYNLPVVSIRPFNVYGPRLDVESDYSLALGRFLKLKSLNKPLTINGDGEQTRGYCYVEDLVEAFILAMQSQKVKGGEVINAGSNKAYSINFLADLIGGEKVYGPERQGDIRHTQADVSLAKELLDWEPKMDFTEGVKKTIEWFNEQTKNEK
ncbi:MAG: NAD-dependent epimerase/dehydratase family protein [Candidatus Pacebacteria bacterium]|nr:NAD-dependent epimerase/dehydratase family protein [Candidatus Paceibacterota bacterium]